MHMQPRRGSIPNRYGVRDGPTAKTPESNKVKLALRNDIPCQNKDSTDHPMGFGGHIPSGGSLVRAVSMSAYWAFSAEHIDRLCLDLKRETATTGCSLVTKPI